MEIRYRFYISIARIQSYQNGDMIRGIDQSGLRIFLFVLNLLVVAINGVGAQDASDLDEGGSMEGFEPPEDGGSEHWEQNGNMKEFPPSAGGSEGWKENGDKVDVGDSEDWKENEDIEDGELPAGGGPGESSGSEQFELNDEPKEAEGYVNMAENLGNSDVDEGNGETAIEKSQSSTESENNNDKVGVIDKGRGRGRHPGQRRNGKSRGGKKRGDMRKDRRRNNDGGNNRRKGRGKGRGNGSKSGKKSRAEEERRR